MKTRVKIKSAHSREPSAGRRRRTRDQTRKVAQTMARSRSMSREAHGPGQGVRRRAGKGRKRPSCRYSRVDRFRRGWRQSLPFRGRRASSRRTLRRPSTPEVRQVLVTKAAKRKRGRQSRLLTSIAMAMALAPAPAEVQARTDSRTPIRRARRVAVQRFRVRTDAVQTRTLRRKEAADGSAQSAAGGGDAAAVPPTGMMHER